MVAGTIQRRATSLAARDCAAREKAAAICGCSFIKNPRGCAMLQGLVASLTAAFRSPTFCCTLPSN